MTGLISLLSFHRCAALSCGDRGQRANVWFLAHVHCHCIESRPQEWRRCRRCSAEAFQRGSTHNNTSKKKRLGLFRSKGEHNPLPQKSSAKKWMWCNMWSVSAHLCLTDMQFDAALSSHKSDFNKYKELWYCMCTIRTKTSRIIPQPHKKASKVMISYWIFKSSFNL